MLDASSDLRPRSENSTGSTCDALRRAIATHYRFASLAFAFIWLGLGAVFYVSDLVRVPTATLWDLLYLSTVCWAFRHERELQRHVEDIRAGRDAVDSINR